MRQSSVPAFGSRSQKPANREGLAGVCGDAVRRDRKVIRVIEDFARRAAAGSRIDRIHAHGLGKILADMHECDPQSACVAVAVQREIVFVFQLAVRIVIDGGDDLRIGARGRVIGRGREGLRMRLQPVERKRLRFSKTQALRRRMGRERRQRLGGQSQFQKITAIEHGSVCPDTICVCPGGRAGRLCPVVSSGAVRKWEAAFLMPNRRWWNARFAAGHGSTLRRGRPQAAESASNRGFILRHAQDEAECYQGFTMRTWAASLLQRR